MEIFFAPHENLWVKKVHDIQLKKGGEVFSE